jgi:two-component system chemotaxis sensor kinase CheA
MSGLDENLLQEFVEESREHLSAIEPDLLILEQQGEQTDAEVINRIFRAIHSIKGASGFFGFEKLKTLSHSMENLLMLVRDKQLSPVPQLMDVLLRGVDKLGALLADIHASEEVPIEEELADLSALLSPQSAKTEESPANDTPPPAAAPAPEAPKSAKTAGPYTFRLTVDAEKDLQAQNRTLDELLEQLKTIATVIDTQNSNGGHTIIFSSVLEADLVSIAVSVPEASIVLHTKEENTAAPKPTEAEKLATPPPVEGTKTQKQSPKATSESESIRVRIELLNKLMALAGELVLSRNQLLRTVEQEATPELAAIAQSIDHITSNLQEHIMQTRMQPIGNIFGKFPRIIRDMAKQLGKEINLVVEGDDVELDKSILESLTDPLTHLIRNCCDHGIEPPEERKQAGKASAGTILLQAFHQDGQINICITDDGRGINTEKLANKVLQKGLLTEAEVKAMSHQELANLIFLPGLSTAEKISDISGRGVGMDVVKTNITKLGGQIHIETAPGEGTSLLLRLPLTLAIIPSLIVGAAEQRFAIPQANLVELVYIPAEQVASRIEHVGNASVLRLRGQLLPVTLSEVLAIQLTTATSQDVLQEAGCSIVVLRSGNNSFALIVDQLFDIEEIVVKSLPGFLKHCKCFSGVTIMGDGRAALILDPSGIVEYTELSFQNLESEQKKEAGIKHKTTKTNTQTLLLFNNHPQETFAVPLADITRLERFRIADIHRIGNGEFLNYENHGLSLIRLEDYMAVGSFPTDQEEAYLIIPKLGKGQVGLIASKILDTVDTAVEWEQKENQSPSIGGWGIIDNHLTVKVDLHELLHQAGFLHQEDVA